MSKGFTLLGILLVVLQIVRVQRVYAAGGPSATNVTITGDPIVGQTLTGSDTYVYSPWKSVGIQGFSDGMVDSTSLAIDPSGTLYVAYTDDQNSNKATVMKYDGINWVVIGTKGFSSDVARYISLAISPSGTPYVAYQSSSDHLVVMKFDGINWVLVGTPGTDSQAYYFSLAIDPSGIPYVAYRDEAHSYKATVIKFNGISWVVVGTKGFSDYGITHVPLAFDTSGLPYVAYEDANSYQTTVMEFNGTNWVAVGTGFSVGGASYISLAINSSGTPYVGYSNWEDNGQATVIKFNGTSWELVGNSKFSDGAADYISLAIDSSGTPYIAYKDQSDNGQATVMKFDGTNWVLLGTKGFSDGQANYISLSTYNGIPYVAYKEGNAGKATVMKYTTPDPTKDPEGNSTYEWYRNGTEIQNATGKTYILTLEDTGTTINFEVTPISKGQEQGDPVQSDGLTIPPSVPGIPQATIGTNLTSQDWSWTASTDAGSGVAQYDWRIESVPSGTTDSGTTTTPTVTTNLDTGNWKFYVKAEDNDGNQSTESSSLLSVFSTSVHETTVDCSVPLVQVITPGDVSDPILDLSPVVTQSGELLVANINCGLHLKSLLSSTTVIVDIPAGAEIQGPASLWSDKVLVPPTTTTTTTIPAPAGYSSQVALAIKIGHTVAPLDITKGVRIFIEGQAGKKAGYISGGVFTEITDKCTTDSQTVGDNLTAGGSCKIDSGSDLVIWTKHFSKFVIYDLVAASSSGTNSSSSSSSSATGCNNSITSGKPDLFEIRVNNKTATLYFTPPTMPYSSFYIAYSRKPDSWEYGTEFNQEYSGGVIKYTINKLSPNTKYYFKMRAGNGCASGNWGNTMTATTTSQVSQSKTFYKNIFTAIWQKVVNILPPTQSINSNPSPMPKSEPAVANPTVIPTPAPTKHKFCILWWCF